jgi:hypothetical protein
MWLFIIYAIVAYAIFTLCYFYFSAEYAPPKEYADWQVALGITLTSMLLGIFWIFIPVIFIIYNLYKSK